MSGPKSSDTRPAAHVALRLDEATRGAARARLAEHGLEARFIANKADLVDRLAEYEWLLIGRPPRIDWSAAGRLRLLQVAGTGVDPLFPAIGLRDAVRVACTRGAQAEAVRDHAFALLLSLARDLPAHREAQSRKAWAPAPAPRLAGRLLVVIGFGAVGSQVAATARSFGLRVRVVCRTVRAITDVEAVIPPEGLHQALEGADFVVVCVPLTSATRHLLDAAALAVLPAHAIVVDVSRGGVIDVRALERALRSGRIRAAALDVFDREPLPPEDSLWSCPGLSVTPHVAGYTPDFMEHAIAVFSENVGRVRRGEEPSGAVSREREY